MDNKDNIGDNLIAFNRYGGFTKDGREYCILNTDTPTPWCNVIANERFGSIISTKGNVYTYFKNSREFKITNWANNWTEEEPSEKILGMFSRKS